ncbi:peptidase [Frigidibacter sp. SD6-1]|uniref:peptidase n=1 Tax=Frigidibacter sp. SD6-1 TaxID=3032581 RepID=UPI0024E02387|nr:peptidase [Frigidibacter sp. SD6-1]
MTVGERAVAAARRWLGTPYRHQASTQGAGADCLGLIRGVWRELYGHEPELPPAYTADWSEPGGEELLWAAALRHLLPVPEEIRFHSGQVALFRMRDGGVAKHLGILSTGPGGPGFIHAYSGHAVVESPLSAPWARRIVARFTFPEGER